MTRIVDDLNHIRYATCAHGRFWAHGSGAAKCAGPHHRRDDGTCACWVEPSPFAPKAPMPAPPGEHFKGPRD